jgi:murein DD-endopeptidase MepM/ murein hydrolase activator NlpD
MPPFSIEILSPLLECNGKNGGPGTGGHVNPAKWYIHFGMDFQGPEGAKVCAAFDGHVTVYHPHVESKDSPSEYGAQIFVRSTDDKLGVFYTHITGVPSKIKTNARIKRGDPLGKVYIRPKSGMVPHLHWALVEIIGPVPGAKYVGVNLYSALYQNKNSSIPLKVTFYQDGKTPPTVER